MGGKDSKPAFITYEDAVRRVTDSELKRLKDAFKRSATLGGYMNKQTFIREVLGDGVPQQMADQMYIAFGGSSKGLAFKDLLCGLVLITRGKEEEKLKFIFGLYANESLSHVQKEQMDALVLNTEGHVPHELSDLFKDADRVPYERFKLWVLYHQTVTSVTKWLLQEPCVVTLSNDLETPTFYQTLAGVTHLEESDIIELEKRYWLLKGQSKSGRFDLDTFQPIVSPPVPQSLVEGLFYAFDENRDNHIDFKEMACGISACCRGPMVERQKFCFKLFDRDHDSLLSKHELEAMIRAMLAVREDNTPPQQMEQDGLSDTSALSLTLDILEEHDGNQDGCITQEEYLVWSVSHPLPAQFMQLLFQVCHVVLGLKPQTKEDEGLVINGWVEREERKNLQVGQTWYLVSMGWWKQWMDYVGVRSNHSPESNNNNNGHKHAGKSSSASKQQSLCSTIVGRKYSSDDAGMSGTYSSLQQPQHGVLLTSSSSAAAVQSANSSPTKYATLPRVSASAHSSPMRANNTAINSRGALDVNSVSPAVSQHSTPSHSPRLGKRSLTNGGTGLLHAPPQKPGQIDNSPLVTTNTQKVMTLTNEGGRLRCDRPLVRGRDFELLPEAVWKALSAWYGGTLALPRTVLQPSHSACGPELELYPLSVRLLRHQQPAPQRPGAAQTGPGGPMPGPAATAVSTFSGVMGGLGTMVANSTGLAGGSSSNSSAVSTPRRYLAYNACFSRKHTLPQLYHFLSTRLRIANEDLRLWKVKDEQNMTLLEEEDMTIEEANIEENCQILIEVRNKDLTWPEELSQLAKTRALASSTQQKTSSTERTERGATGLNNLGNTCFMNSALQCVSNTRGLTLYFTGGMHLYEMNRSNPLGMKGHIAQRYGDLVKDMWSGTARSIAPLKLRWTIGKYAPRFNGYQQHDCQELLAFLLDGLHEDLNRVHDKPYVELKDSDGRPDEIVAKEAWENHMLRNRSIIVDLFCGQLKSQVRCKECGHTSVRFDPFTYLSLPLPMDSCIHLEITVMRLDGSTPTKYGLRLNMDEKYKGLKKQLSQLTSIPMTQILLVEVFGALVKAFPLDGHKLRTLLGGGSLYAYELPPPPPIPTMTAAEERWLAEHPIILTPAAPAPAAPSSLSQIQRSNPPTGPSPSPSLPPVEKPPSQSTPSSSSSSSNHNTAPQKPTNHNTPAANQNTAQSKNPANQSPAEVQENPPTNQNAGFQKQTTFPTQPTNQNHVNKTPPSLTDSESLPPKQQQQQQLPNGNVISGSGLNNGFDSPMHGTGSQQAKDSGSCAMSPGSQSLSTADVFSGFIVAVHRKTIRMDVYFLSSRKTRPSMFGTPLIIPCDEESTCADLYQAVWTQVARLVSPLPPSETSNHAQDCDDSLRYEYPFSLKLVQKDPFVCAQCPWYRFCRGCTLECSPTPFQFASCFIAIDWEPTALHLRYQTSQEKTYYEHISVAESRRLQTEPIDLDACLKAFTKEEQLADDELYYCSKCSKHQLAEKKLDIWRLPPVLIIHLKRFQFLNGRWVKSQKIVNFPFHKFDPTNYVAKRSNIPETPADSQSNAGLHISTVNGATNHNTDAVSGGRIGAGENVKNNGRVPNGNAQPICEGPPPPKKADAEVAKEASEEDVMSDDGTEDYSNVRYNLNALACHTGILGGGHYVAYGKNPNNKWYSYNDSMCREVAEEEHIDKNSAYILFYERESLEYAKFMPEVTDKEPDTSEIDDEFESDLKKMCVVQ